jgi:5-methyltetrahydrofolate--homocysteine methyltransferase
VILIVRKGETAMADLSEIAQSLVEWDTAKTEELTRAAIAANIPAQEILNKDVVAGMRVVGEQFGSGEIFLPELLLAGEAAKAAMTLLKPLLTKQDGVTGYTGKAAIGTVQGDVHDIGKNIIIMMLEANGWEITDLGVDVAPEDFCAAVEENDFQILGISALLTGTMPNQRETIEALKAAGLEGKVKVAIGGAMCTQHWADQIGADCYAADAAEVVEKFRLLVQ